ncbi:2-C-methyl-D-erythritol 2,4-cyclodiphosphate synthase [bacterium]|nr:2-C-methyl-D-erythritol 2,4-cyclodiphosphate synthase [bacterium]
MKIGLGYDIHKTASGKGLRLGGVTFPEAGFKLKGHSDADVILHAACDALLGAAGLPDIGQLFPNTSPCHQGRNSLEFLTEVGKQLQCKGYQPVNLDCTLLAENPKIASQVALMQRRIARALKISPDMVSVKATTNEGLGAIGRGEGLAAMAVALIEMV